MLVLLRVLRQQQRLQWCVLHAELLQGPPGCKVHLSAAECSSGKGSTGNADGQSVSVHRM
jgi:hypothetical protein